MKVYIYNIVFPVFIMGRNKGKQNLFSLFSRIPRENIRLDCPCCCSLLVVCGFFGNDAAFADHNDL